MPLRLVSVIKPTHRPRTTTTTTLRMLRKISWGAVARPRVVKIEKPIPREGQPARCCGGIATPKMICVGSVGIGRYASSILGSTAERPKKAHCPVAVMRSKSGPASV